MFELVTSFILITLTLVLATFAATYHYMKPRQAEDKSNTLSDALIIERYKNIHSNANADQKYWAGLEINKKLDARGLELIGKIEVVDCDNVKLFEVKANEIRKRKMV